MMETRDPVDVVLQIFEWASALLSSVSLGIAGIVFNRSSADRARMEDRFEKIEQSIMAGDRALRDELRDDQRTAAAFRERIAEAMVTKTDLREMERRLSTLLQAESRGRRVPPPLDD